ncbi:MAG: SgcJ/EcaC family oxidoreductase [Bryobacteraceae bacterium]
MKIKLLNAVSVSLLLASHGLVAAETPNDEESRIRQIVAEQVQAWNIGDAKAFALRFAEDGSFTNIRGSVFYGHRAFEERHAKIFSTFFKGSKLAMSVTRIRFLRPDVAIADVAAEVSELHGTPPGIKTGADAHIHTRLQEIFVKNRGEWEIAAYHNVDVKE